MKNAIRKIIAVMLVLTSAFFVFTACKRSSTDIKLIVPDGSPSLAIAKLLKDKPTYAGYNISYEIVAGATEIQTKFVNGEATLAILPTNMASIFYNTKGAKLLSVNTHGVLYLLGKQNATTLQELKGNIVYNIGRGSVPDITFKHILTQNDIVWTEGDTVTDQNKVFLSYVTNGAELIPLLKTGTAKFGILGEPAVSQAILVAEATELFSISQLWTECVEDSIGYPQAALTAQKEFAVDSNKAFLAWLLNQIKESAEWIKENPTEAVEAAKAYGSTMNANLSAEIVNRCNIWVGGANAEKASVEAFLNTIMSFNAQAIGGKLPSGDFYYEVFED